MGFPGGVSGKEPASQCKRFSLIPGSGRSPGGEYGNPLQYSCLENSMDRGAWQATDHGPQRVGHNWVTEHMCVRIHSCVQVLDEMTPQALSIIPGVGAPPINILHQEGWRTVRTRPRGPGGLQTPSYFLAQIRGSHRDPASFPLTAQTAVPRKWRTPNCESTYFPRTPRKQGLAWPTRGVSAPEGGPRGQPHPYVITPWHFLPSTCPASTNPLQISGISGGSVRPGPSGATTPDAEPASPPGRWAWVPESASTSSSPDGVRDGS